VLHRYETSMAGGVAASSDNDLSSSSSSSSRGQFGIVLCSLLRCNPTTPAETQLAGSYQESLKHVQSLVPSASIRMFNFDWHHNLKQLGSDAAISGLWGLIAPFVKSGCGLSRGTVRLHDPKTTKVDSLSIHSCPDGHLLVPHVAGKQRGVLRYNCADSLDRTNVATFFVSFQIVLEMLRSLGRTVVADVASVGTPVLGESETWPHFSTVTTVAQAAKALGRLGALDLLVEYFVQNGDVCSLLYTNSPAMHTGPMREFASDRNKELQSTPMTALIAIRRRYHNLFTDSIRHAQFALFLGRKLHRFVAIRCVSVCFCLHLG
jgi:hypothetical protein